MTDAEELFARMDVAERRLAVFAEDPPPGLTDPDPATGEQWDAGQAWAHVAEFVPYWQGEIEHVLSRHGAAVVAGDDPWIKTFLAEPAKACSAGRSRVLYTTCVAVRIRVVSSCASLTLSCSCARRSDSDMNCETLNAVSPIATMPPSARPEVTSRSL